MKKQYLTYNVHKQSQTELPNGIVIGDNNLSKDSTTDESIQCIYEYKNEEMIDKTNGQRKRRNHNFAKQYESESEALLEKD